MIKNWEKEESLLARIKWMDPEGRTGGSDSDPPPLKIAKLPSQHSMLVHLGPPAKRYCCHGYRHAESVM